VKPEYGQLSSLRSSTRGPGSALRTRLIRVAGTLVAALIVTTPIMAIAFDLVPRTGPASALLIIHDYGYLPLRGALWSYGYPSTLLVWVPLLLIAFAALCDWLMGVSVLRAMQNRLILLLLRFLPGQAILSGWHRLAGGGRLRAHYLEAAVAAQANMRLEGALQSAVETGELFAPEHLSPLIVLSARMRARFACDPQRMRILGELVSIQAMLILGGFKVETELKSIDAETSSLLDTISQGEEGEISGGLPTSQKIVLAQRAWAVWLIRMLIHEERAEEVGRSLAGYLRHQRIALALLAARHEIRPSAKADVVVEEGDDLAGAILALSIAGIALTGAVFAEDAGEEVRATLQELDRVHFAITASTRDTGRAERLLAQSYAAACRDGFGEELRAFLELEVTSIRRDAGTAFGISAYSGVRAGPIPETLGLRGASWSYFGAQGDRDGT
jgi:hypothetical protein